MSRSYCEIVFKHANFLYTFRQFFCFHIYFQCFCSDWIGLDAIQTIDDKVKAGDCKNFYR